MNIDAIMYEANGFHTSNSRIVNKNNFLKKNDIPNNSWITIIPNTGEPAKFIHANNYRTLPWFITGGNDYENNSLNEAIIPKNNNNHINDIIEYGNIKYNVVGFLDYPNSLQGQVDLLKGEIPFSISDYDAIEIDCYDNIIIRIFSCGNSSLAPFSDIRNEPIIFIITRILLQLTITVSLSYVSAKSFSGSKYIILIPLFLLLYFSYSHIIGTYISKYTLIEPILFNTITTLVGWSIGALKRK